MTTTADQTKNRRATTAGLILSGSTLQIIGDQNPTSISASFTPAMVRALFNMPPDKDLVVFSPPTISATDILRRLTKPSYASFLQVVNSDKKLKAEHDEKVASLAAYAHPTTGRWPQCDPLMVLETIPIDLPWLLSVSWLMDGTIVLSYLMNSDVMLMTPEEFKILAGMDYKEYTHTHLPLAIEKCQRALSILSVDKPTKASVTYVNKDSAVETKTMVYWQADQIEQYLTRHSMSHIATDPE